MAHFYTQRGVFYLLALVIGVQMLIALIVVSGCVGGLLFGILPMGVCEKVSNPLLDILNMCFTAVIAFAGGRMSAPVTPPKETKNEDN